MSFYREKILDHYKNPRNAGVLENADCSAHEDNPLCGDIVYVFVKVKDNVIEDARFKGEGCAISIAASSMLLEKVKGMQCDAVLKMSEKDIIALLGISLTISRAKCGTLGLTALHKALKKLKNFKARD